jgi:hypothetical protein
VVFAGSWNAVDANNRDSNFKELGTHPDPSCLFTVAQQLICSGWLSSFQKETLNPSRKSCDEEGLKVFRVHD